MKRKTHQEFIYELNNINSNIEIIEEYKNANTKLLCKCKIDGYEWYSKPSNLLQGRGCPKCSGRIKTHEEFIEEMKIVNPTIKIIGRYERSAKKIECCCLIHNYKWFAKPNNLLNKRGCPLCGNEKLRDYKLFSQEEFVNKLKNINPYISVLGDYKGNKENIEVKCLKCNYKWTTKGNSLLQGKGCPKCGGSLKKTNEDFELELKNVKPHIIPIEKYSGALTNIKFRCLIHNCEWYDTPVHVLRDRGCPECAKESYRELRMKPHQVFIDEMKIINPQIEILSEYNGVQNKLLCQCKIDNHKWMSYPNSLLKGYGCPICASYFKSKGEEKISNFLKINNIEFLTQYSFDKLVGLKGGLLLYDFYIPKYNILIEYNGEQHYRPIDYFGGEEKFKVQQEHDRRKREYAENNGFQFIEIGYWDFNNIDEILNRIIQEAA